MLSLDEYYKAYLKQNEITCTCGDPEYGTPHAPDCEIELAWGEAIESYFDEKFELEHHEQY